MFTRYCFCLLLLLTSQVATSAEQQNLTFYTELYPPANFMAEGQLQGISVDSLKLMWQHMDMVEQDMIVVPWARGYKNTLSNPNTALFTMSRTEARDPLFKWVGPLFKSVHVLMAKKSSKVKVKHIGDLFNYRVATIRGDISEISLQQIGYPDYNMAKVSDLSRAFYMMQSNKVDMLMVSIHGFEHLTRGMNVDLGDYEKVWTVNTVGNYIAFNINTPDHVIEQYQQALEATAKERIKVKQKYKLSKLEY